MSCSLQFFHPVYPTLASVVAPCARGCVCLSLCVCVCVCVFMCKHGNVRTPNGAAAMYPPLSPPRADLCGNVEAGEASRVIGGWGWSTRVTLPSLRDFRGAPGHVTRCDRANGETSASVSSAVSPMIPECSRIRNARRRRIMIMKGSPRARPEFSRRESQ